MRLAIADPPYPPNVLAAGGRKIRASRWYGPGLATSDQTADLHRDAAEWDDPARHAALLAHLVATYDGWAIATTPDGIYAYGVPPVGTRLLSWHKPGSTPGAHRIRSEWEVVILYPPADRRSGRGVRTMTDTLTASVTRHLRRGFAGAKPPAWTRWVLDGLGYDPDTDTVTDLFPGSGAVANAVAQGVLL